MTPSDLPAPPLLERLTGLGFLNALDDLDRQLATALELFACAGFSPNRTARFLLNQTHLDHNTVTAAMIVDQLEHHPSTPHVPTDDIARINAVTHAAITAARADTPANSPGRRRPG